MNWLRRLRRRQQSPGPAVALPLASETVELRGVLQPPRSAPRAVVVDGNTRTFWARGEAAATTVIETDGGVNAVSVSRQVEAELNRRAGAGPTNHGRPRGNPAFSEALFIELMRAGQFERAYALLSPACQAGWGSVDAFAALQREAGLDAITGVAVRDATYLERWVDPISGVEHDHVAELTVDYSMAAGRGTTTVSRTVHLISVEGRWRSLCPPPADWAALAG